MVSRVAGRPFGIFLLVATIFGSVTLAQRQEITVDPGRLVELRIELPEGDADVTWEPRQPFDLDFLTFEEETACVLYSGKAGSQYVVIADVILWDARKRQKTIYVVNVGGGPDPPDPPNPPGPTPEPPNEYRVGKITFDLVSQIPQPAQGHANAIGVIWESGAARLAATSGDLVDDINTVTRAISNATTVEVGADAAAWQPFRDRMNKAFLDAWNGGKNSAEDRSWYVGMIREVGTTLQLFQ